MVKLWRYLRDHVRSDFSIGKYAAIAVFLTCLLISNYALGFEENYLESVYGWRKYLAYLLFYSALYFASVAIQSFADSRWEIFKNTKFWLASLFGLAVMSLDSSVFFLSDLVDGLTAPQIRLWAYKVTVNMISFLTVFLPIVLFYLLLERKGDTVYGLRPRHAVVKPYLLMLLIMMPVIAAASFHPSFLKQYPMYKVTAAHAFLNVPEWITVAAYEVAYALDFITVELLFRGFFVIGMAAFLNRSAVLSMAVIYCALHFGKPVGEAISSIFGGYILGVLAYETKSIWGGVIVHIGVAWMMEAIAYLQTLWSLPS